MGEETEKEENEQEAPEPSEAGIPEDQNDGESKRRTSGKLWTPYGDQEAAPEEARGEPPEAEMTEEELRRRVEEAMEKITTADVVLDMMVTLSSFAYQRMGLPKDVNDKFRDLDQAKLAIDCLDALLGVLTDRIPAEQLKPLAGTVDNLKLNFVKES